MSTSSPENLNRSLNYTASDIHEVAREAYEFLKREEFSRASRRKIIQLERYSADIAESIDSLSTSDPRLDISYPDNVDIYDGIENVERKGVIGESLNFMNEKYDIGSKYIESQRRTRWERQEFDTDEISKISEILDGFTDSL